jgi:hypothetical protein
MQLVEESGAFTLAHLVQLGRSKDPKNNLYNLIHGGGAPVQVVAVHMTEAGGTQLQTVIENGRPIQRQVAVGGSIADRFRNLTRDQILGPPPPQGVQAVIRPARP